MTVNTLLRSLKPKMPYILAGTSVLGFALTLKSAWTTFPKAQLQLEEARIAYQDYRGKQPTKLEETKAIIRLTAPTLIFAGLTVTSMIAYVTITRQQIAALASAYAVLNEKFNEYRRHVEADTDAKVMATISRNSTDEDFGAENLLYYIDHYDNMFNRTAYQVLKAENALNHLLTRECCASLTDFFNLLGLEPTPISDMLGWDDSTPWIEIRHEKVILDDGLECYMIKFDTEPSTDFLPF